MKKLVKKIALPGAILAFAMALFGGSAYAEEIVPIFKEWEKHTQGQQHQEKIKNSQKEIKKSIEELANRIKALKKQKADLESVLQTTLDTSDVSVSEVRKKIEAKNLLIQRLERDKADLLSDRDKMLSDRDRMIFREHAENKHNKEIEKAEDAMGDVWSHTQGIAQDIQDIMENEEYKVPENK